MYEIFNKSKFLSHRKELRKNLTPQELKLWFYLKSSKLGVKFRRQHGVGPYIADFYCKEKNLIIELDGATHKDTKEYDNERNEYMKTLGLKVIRFWNSEIERNIDEVIKKIKEEITPPPDINRTP